MSDETPTTPAPRKAPAARKNETIEDAVVVDEPAPSTASDAAASPVKVVPVTQTESPSAPQVVYVQTPAPPRKAGNRGIGSLLAIVSGLIYAALFAGVVALILAAQVGSFTFAFLANATFYVPVLFFVVASVLVVLIVNRAGWAAHVVGSLVVGVVVYFGTIGVLLLNQGVILQTPAEAAVLFSEAARNPIVIAAALLAREVALWSGAVIGRRGRSLKARNAVAREAWAREVAETRAAHERGAAAE